MRIVTNRLFRVADASDAWLVETSGNRDVFEELVEFCAAKAASGCHITSVTEIMANSRMTPRIAVLSTPEFKRALAFAEKNHGRVESMPWSIEEIIKRAEAEGWKASLFEDPDDPVVQLTLETQLPNREYFSIPLKGMTAQDIVDDLNDSILDFDADDYVNEIMDTKGDSNIAALTEEAKTVEEMLHDLQFAITHTGW